MLEIIVKALVSLIDGIMAIFGIAHHAEKHLSDNSRVGKSKMDSESHELRENIFHSWWIIGSLLLVFFGGAGFALWNIFSR